MKSMKIVVTAALFDGVSAALWCTRRMTHCMTFLKVRLVDQIKAMIFNRHRMHRCGIRIFFTHAVNQTAQGIMFFKESAEPGHRKIIQAHFSSLQI